MKHCIKKSLKVSNGITLIALVITIIILLILAGISISMLAGDNSILQKATDAKTYTEKASIIEQAKTDILAQIAENKGENITKQQLKDILNIYFDNSEVSTLNIPDDTSTSNDKLTSKEGAYKINLSEIYSGKFTSQPLEAGLYNAETDELIYNWDDLLANGNYIAIYNNSLQRRGFQLPENVNKMKLVIKDDGTFNQVELVGVQNLTEIVLPETISNYTIQGCSHLTKFSIPSSVTTIRNSSFSGCSSLVDIYIPDSVTSIEAGAFNSCTSLMNIYIPSNVINLSPATNFDGHIFSNCSPSLKIYCGISSKPSGWDSEWNNYSLGEFDSSKVLDTIWRKN